MRKLKEFKLFVEEVKLGDILKVTSKSGSDIENILKTKKKGFDRSEPLSNLVNIKVSGKKRKARIFYYDTKDHRIMDRIENRTGMESSNEFNIYLSNIINDVVLPRIGEEIDRKGRYIIYDKDKNFSTVLSLDPEKIIKEDKYKFKLITIIQGHTGGENYYKKIQI